MRLAIEHRTLYHFTAPQARLVQLLRLTPADTFNQTTVHWRIDVSCDARLREGTDGFGNLTTMLYAEGPIAAIEVTVLGEVLTTRGTGVLMGVDETLPRAVYQRATPMTKAGEAIHAFTGASIAGIDDPLERLTTLCRALGDRFSNRARWTDSTEAEAMFAAPEHSSRDLAQMFVACARTAGAPARFVSGYALAGVERDGGPVPHGWAEAYVEDLGWVGFDPSFGQSPDETYVRLAIGLDAMGAAPLAGTRIGHGEEALNVDLQVNRLGGEE